MPNPEAYVFVAASGEQQRGSPGCVWVDGEAGRCEYLLLREIPNDDLRSGIEDMISEDAEEHFFIVHKHGESAHVFKYPKRKAFAEIMSGAIASPVTDESNFASAPRLEEKP